MGLQTKGKWIKYNIHLVIIKPSKVIQHLNELTFIKPMNRTYQVRSTVKVQPSIAHYLLFSTDQLKDNNDKGLVEHVMGLHD